MAETRATLLSLDQRVDLRKVREIVGKDVLLGGNLDPVEVLLKQTPEKVDQAARKCYEDGGPDQFILMPGCTILPDTPVENIRAMMQVAKEAG
jgi:uroporphyrinogen decarboxylase